MSDQPFIMVFAICPDLTHLDFTGPHRVLCRRSNAKAILASREGGTIRAEGGRVIGETERLAEAREAARRLKAQAGTA